MYYNFLHTDPYERTRRKNTKKLNIYTSHTHNYILIAHNQRPFRGRVIPGRYAGMARDLSTLFVNFKPGIWWGGGGGGLDCFCTFVAGSPGEHPRICSVAAIFQSWKRVLFPSAKGLVGRLVNTFWQNGDREDCLRLSYFSCILFLLSGLLHLHSDYIFRKKNTIPSIQLF